MHARFYRYIMRNEQIKVNTREFIMCPYIEGVILAVPNAVPLGVYIQHERDNSVVLIVPDIIVNDVTSL